MVVFVLIINHIIKNKNYENYTLLYIYIYKYILNLVFVFVLKKLYLHRYMFAKFVKPAWISERFMCQTIK